MVFTVLSVADADDDFRFIHKPRSQMQGVWV